MYVEQQTRRKLMVFLDERKVQSHFSSRISDASVADKNNVYYMKQIVECLYNIYRTTMVMALFAFSLHVNCQE